MTKKKLQMKTVTAEHSVSDSTPIDFDDLYLDPRNPRLAEKQMSLKDQPEILKVLWQERTVNGVVLLGEKPKFIKWTLRELPRRLKHKL